MRHAHACVALLVLQASALSCATNPTPRTADEPPGTRRIEPKAREAEVAPEAVVEPPEPPREPTAPVEPARFVALPVPGFLDAVVSLPGGPLAPEPVLLATHGAGGAPEHHCEAWRRRLGPRGVVVCPRGAMINRIEGPDAGFYYPDHHALEREVLATVQALRSEFAEYIDGGPMLYAGYSQGATMGALVLPDHAELFPRAVLVEGGFSEWNLVTAKRFAERGGLRVLFVCGVRRCKAGADRSAAALRRARLAVEARLAAGAGHTYLGPVAGEIAQGFSWLVADDTRWD